MPGPYWTCYWIDIVIQFWWKPPSSRSRYHITREARVAFCRLQILGKELSLSQYILGQCASWYQNSVVDLWQCVTNGTLWLEKLDYDPFSFKFIINQWCSASSIKGNLNLFLPLHFKERSGSTYISKKDQAAIKFLPKKCASTPQHLEQGQASSRHSIVLDVRKNERMALSNAFSSSERITCRSGSTSVACKFLLTFSYVWI